MKWTKETPTEPGWYWRRGRCVTDVIYIQRASKSEQLFYCVYDTTAPITSTPAYDWAGPIPSPTDSAV